MTTIDSRHDNTRAAAGPSLPATPAHVSLMSCQTMDTSNAHQPCQPGCPTSKHSSTFQALRWHHTGDLFTKLAPSFPHTYSILASAAQPQLMHMGQSSAGDGGRAQPRARNNPAALCRLDLMHANLDQGVGHRSRTGRSLPSSLPLSTPSRCPRWLQLQHLQSCTATVAQRVRRSTARRGCHHLRCTL